MSTLNRWTTATAVAAILLVLGAAAQAAEPVPTTITVERMCEGCAKKITAKLQGMPGVAAVRTNVPAKIVMVLPRQQTVLSPRSLWEAVENSGEHPVRLEGPSGTFTAKPKF